MYRPRHQPAWLLGVLILGAALSVAGYRAPALWVVTPAPITRAPAGVAPAAAEATARFAPVVSIGPGSSPGGGYLPLSLFGITPIAGVGDDTLTNFTVPSYWFGGELYTRLGVASNGYLVLGGGDPADISFLNQYLPNPVRPNNVLALFWTDLNPAAAGAVRIGVLTDGSDSWIVVDWEAVREFSSSGKTHSFQAWIGVSSDAHPDQDVSFVYGAQTGNGDGGFATIGVENWKASSGAMAYFNGIGTLPIDGTQLRVTTSFQLYLPAVSR